MCHYSDTADGEKAAAVIRGAATPLIDLLGPLAYPVQNTLLDDESPKAPGTTGSPHSSKKSPPKPCRSWSTGSRRPRRS
jgi:hypothetical protein